MDSKKNPPRETAARRGEPSSLFQKLLQKLTAQRPPPAPATDEMPPPGKRSGRGSHTVAKYLEHARSTRPGSLE